MAAVNKKLYAYNGHLSVISKVLTMLLGIKKPERVSGHSEDCSEELLESCSEEIARRVRRFLGGFHPEHFMLLSG